MSQYAILLTKVHYMEHWVTLTALKTQNQEHGVVMIQCLWCSKIKKRTIILLYLLGIKMAVKINDLLIQSLNAKRSFIFKNVVKLK